MMVFSLAVRYRRLMALLALISEVFAVAFIVIIKYVLVS